MASLPSGYTQLEYIESSGTQYINSNFYANQNSRVYMDFEYLSGDVVFGAYNTSGTAGFGLQAASNQWYTYYGSSSSYSGVAVTTKTRYQADLNKNVFYLNGEIARIATPNTFTGQNPLLIFCLQNAGFPAFYASIKLFSCKIYDNGVLARDYVPCRNPQFVAGLFDILNGQFYANAGTGSFTEGPEIPQDEANIYAKINGVWQPASAIYAKVNGAW